MLNIYYLETCPYCQKVLAYLKENNIEYIPHDVSDLNEYNDLKLIGGKEQVPYMFDSKNKIGMYESDNIINYLKKFQCK